MLGGMLKLDGPEIGGKHVGTLMKKLDSQAIYRKTKLTRPDKSPWVLGRPADPG